MVTIYVDKTVSPGGTGVYDDPFDTIQLALNAAASGDTIYIKPVVGAYDPLTSVYREAVKHVTAIDNVRITTSKSNPAIWSPAVPTQAADWTSLGSDLYALIGGFTVGSVSYFSNGDPLTVYDLTETPSSATGSVPKAKWISNADYVANGLGEGEYTYGSSIVVYKTSDSSAPANNQIAVPVSRTTAIESSILRTTAVCNNWIIENLKIIECGPKAILLEANNVGWLIRDCTFDGSVEHMIEITSDNQRVINCKFLQNGPYNDGVTTDLSFPVAGKLPAAIYIEDASNCLVSNNDISDFVDSGVLITHPSGTSSGNNVVIDNFIHGQSGGNGGAGLYAYDKQNTTVFDYWRGNVVQDCLENAMVIEGSSYNSIFNNTFAYNNRGLHLVKKTTSETSFGNEFVNNIVAESGQEDAFWTAQDPTNLGLRSVCVSVEFDESTDTAEDVLSMQDNMMRKNLYYKTGGSAYFRFGSNIHRMTEWKYYARTYLVQQSESDSEEGDPEFVDASVSGGDSTSLKDDFRVAITSTANNNGIDLDGIGDNSSAAWEIATRFIKWGTARDQGAFPVEQTALYPKDDIVPIFTIPNVVPASDIQDTLKEGSALTSYGGELSLVPFKGKGLFPEIDGAEITAEQTRYRALDFVNLAIKPGTVDNNSTGNTVVDNISATEGELDPPDGATGVQVYISQQSDLGYTINVQWEDASGAYDAAAASDTTAPTGGITFPSTPPNSTSPDERTGVLDIQPTTSSAAATGDNARLYIARVVTSDAVYADADITKIRILGKQNSG